MDADGSHQPEQLPRLLAALPDADLVLGSRWVPGGSVVNWPARRRALSQGGNVYVRKALGLGVHDATGGYRAFRRSTLEKLDLAGVASHGYCFQVDLVWRTVQQGLRVTEVPIEFVERVRGDSKMNGAIVREALWRVTVWAARERATRLRAGVAGREGLTRMGWFLVVAFLIVPIVEIYVIVQVGQQIGRSPDGAPADLRERPRRLDRAARGQPGLARAADGARPRDSCRAGSWPTPRSSWSAARCC